MSNFNFKKKYGQNFLQDKNIINNIVNSINPTNNDLIIEIGPGGGALTRILKKYGAKLFAYEIDKDVQTYLNELLDDNTKVIYDDFLNRNIQDDIKNLNYNYFIPLLLFLLADVKIFYEPSREGTIPER